MPPAGDPRIPRFEGGLSLRGGSEQLLYGKSENAKHEMCEDFGVTTDSDETSPETVFDTGESTFCRCSKSKAPGLVRIKVFLGFGPRIVVNDWDVVQSNAVLTNESIIICGVHQVVEAGDSLCCDARQRDGGLTIVH